MKALRPRSNGFTLIEIMVGIMIFAVVLVVIYSLIISSTNTVAREKMAIGAQQNLRVGMDEIIKDIRQAGFGIGAPPAFSMAGKRTVSFWADIDADEPTNLIRYFTGDGTDLIETRNPNDTYMYREDLSNGEPAIPIARGVRSIEFQYFDENGVALLNGATDAAVVESDTLVADMNANGVPDINEIRSISITLTFEPESPSPKYPLNGGYAQYALNTTIHPVNLKLLERQRINDKLLDVTISPDPTPGIVIGDEVQFTATAEYQVAGLVDVTTAALWISSDTTVATINTFVPGGINNVDPGLATAENDGITYVSCIFNTMASSNAVVLKVGGPAVEGIRINGYPSYALVQGSAVNVSLTATITDLAYGGATIMAAEWSQASMGVSSAMAASDGAFDTPQEPVQDIVSIAGWTAAGSPYPIRVHGKDVSNPLTWGPPDSTNLVVMPSDVLGPIVSSISPASPVVLEGTSPLVLTATVDDIPTGGSTIAAAEGFVGALGSPGTGLAMVPFDGALDSPKEVMTLTLDTSSWSYLASPYRVYLHGLDAPGNWGREVYLDVVVASSDTAGPVIVTLNGPGNITSGDPQVDLTGVASDSLKGGSNVMAVEAYADTDPGLGLATPMSPTDGAFNSPVEAFYGAVSSFAWAVGTNHNVYARARDDRGNWGASQLVTVSVTSAINGKDAVVALGNGYFEVWHGDGVGGFKASENYYAGIAISDIDLAELNGDGAKDIALSSTDGDLQIWTNNGSGGFGIAPAQTIAVGSPVSALVVVDVNLDGFADIVCCTQVGTLPLYLNDGAGTFVSSTYLTYEDTHLDFMKDIVTADFNGDLLPDVAVGGTYNLGSGEEEFQALLHPGAAGGDWSNPKHRHYAGSLAGLVAGDFDNDGSPDVTLAVNGTASGNGLQFWSGSGTGLFTETVLQPTGDEILSIDTRTYNADATLDVVLGTTGATAQEVRVVYGMGDGTFNLGAPKVVDLTVGVSAATFGYMDQDAELDLVTGGLGAGSLFSFVQLSTEELQQVVNAPFSMGDSAVAIKIAQMDP